jgi:hypothetical protein
MNRRKAHVLGLLLLVASFGCAGCCGNQGCEDGLAISFHASQPGAYVFTINADDKTITCKIVLPAPECQASDCDGPADLLQENCGGGVSGESVGGVQLHGIHPKDVEVAVTRDGVEIVRESFAPTYQEISPNGDMCGPTCNHDRVTLDGE